MTGMLLLMQSAVILLACMLACLPVTDAIVTVKVAHKLTNVYSVIYTVTGIILTEQLLKYITLYIFNTMLKYVLYFT